MRQCLRHVQLMFSFTRLLLSGLIRVVFCMCAHDCKCSQHMVNRDLRLLLLLFTDVSPDVPESASLPMSWGMSAFANLCISVVVYV